MTTMTLWYILFHTYLTNLAAVELPKFTDCVPEEHCVCFNDRISCKYVNITALPNGFPSNYAE